VRSKLLAVAVTGRGAVDPDEPVVHADDEAFARGRGAFETLRVYGGRPFRLDDHLARLEESVGRLGLLPVDRPALAGLVDEVLAAAGVPDDVYLRLTWSPGREGRGQPLGLAVVGAVPEEYEAQRERGLSLLSFRLGQDGPPLLGGVKSTSYALNMVALDRARSGDADDAVFLARDDVVLEGPTTNVWWRRGRTLFTPTIDLGILAGVTRAALVEAAPALGYLVEEGAFPVGELAGAEEAFTSSSVREVMPVVAIDGGPIGDGRPGPAARRLQAALRAAAVAP
jgi:branched-subunit amino acid aminotransferase/4-amino-4-deoxychorismate lyase